MNNHIHAHFGTLSPVYRDIRASTLDTWLEVATRHLTYPLEERVYEGVAFGVADAVGSQVSQKVKIGVGEDGRFWQPPEAGF